METYVNRNIQEIPLSSPYFHSKVERFLSGNGLRMEALDSYYTIENSQGDILAGAGLYRDIVKCVAVSESARSEGLVAPLVSHILAQAAQAGITCLKVFTKPENEAIFASLGFHTLAAAPQAILMENGRGLEHYCAYLRTLPRSGRTGVVVMNANPFTLGHQYLLKEAASQVDTLFVIPVKEDLSAFPYTERLEMIRGGVCPTAEENYFSGSFPKNQFSPAFAQIVVAEGSDYQISAATFPTYFLKDLSAAAETQMRLDLDLFARHIAPALGAEVRFVGTEPADALTARYNTLMKEVLPQVVEIPRLEAEGGAVSASAVRKALEGGSFAAAAALTPVSSHPFLLAQLAQLALREEVDLPLKPGLVGPDSPGAHADMNYATMLRSIAALRPFWARIALAPSARELRELGIEAEKAMMEATGGVNTHRGAIFCIGLALNAWAHGAHTEEDMHLSIGEIAGGIYAKSQRVNNLPPRGAMAIALDGYRPLFEDWLPYYSESRDARKTLLRIMSTLDDTCVLHRAGEERAARVKEEAKMLLEDYSEEKLTDLCTRYATEGISPGGAADMLSLTILTYSLFN